MHPAEATLIHRTANDDLKERSRTWLPRSIVIAVLFHVAVFTLSPDMTIADEATVPGEMDVIIPAEVDLPEPPAPLEKPAEPIVGSLEIDADVTISPTTPETWKPDLRAPERVRSDDESAFQRFTVSMVAPRLLNTEEIERELTRNYPSVLRDAGIGGVVDVNLWLDENGVVTKSEIARSSGYQMFDEAALKVVAAMRLAPALNGGAPVRVIVTLPVHFRVQ
ncbi:MAG TPA: TonB family protein [Longimicrobiales bacterium]|nr:TonB family protein [Longimicrobiales bacterium]